MPDCVLVLLLGAKGGSKGLDEKHSFGMHDRTLYDLLVQKLLYIFHCPGSLIEPVSVYQAVGKDNDVVTCLDLDHQGRDRQEKPKGE